MMTYFISFSELQLTYQTSSIKSHINFVDWICFCYLHLHGIWLEWKSHHLHAKSMKKKTISDMRVIQVFITRFGVASIIAHRLSWNEYVNKLKVAQHTQTHTYKQTRAHVIDKCGDNKEITNFQSKASSCVASSELLTFICVSLLFVAYHTSNGAYLVTALKWEVSTDEPVDVVVID